MSLTIPRPQPPIPPASHSASRRVPPSTAGATASPMSGSAASSAGWEYKGKHKDLDTAFDQLLRYRNALENPPLLGLCDLDRIVVRTNFTGTVSDVHEIPPKPSPSPQHRNHAPSSQSQGSSPAAPASPSQEAAARIGEIAAAMRERARPGTSPTSWTASFFASSPKTRHSCPT